MPELPEVETVKTYVCKKVLNKKIKNIKVLDKKLRWPIDSKKICKMTCLLYTSDAADE